MSIIQNAEYKSWLKDLKSTIQQSQIKAALAVNSQLIILYFYLGSQIVENKKLRNGEVDLLINLAKI